MTTQYKLRGSTHIRFFCIDVGHCDGTFITATAIKDEVKNSDANFCPKCGGPCIESKFAVS